MSDEEMKDLKEDKSSLPNTEAKADENVDEAAAIEAKKGFQAAHQKGKAGGRRGARAAKRREAGITMEQTAEADADDIVEEKTEIEIEVKAEEAGNDSPPKETTTAEQPPGEKIVIKPGAQLAAKREELGMTLEQIASRLKMTARQVRELEADNYDTGNGVAVSRGFIRAYAKILKMDSEPLIAMLSDGKKAEKQEPAPRKRESRERFTQNKQNYHGKRNTGKVIGYLVFIAVLIGILMLARNMGWFSFDFKKKAEETSTVNSEVPSNTVSSEVNPPAVVMSDSGQKPQDAAQAPAGDTLPGAPTSFNPGEVSQIGDALIIHFTGQTWVQVLRADSSIMYEYRGNAGEIQKLEIKEPVTLVVGEAPGVEASFRGVRLDLQSTEGSSIARVSLK